MSGETQYRIGMAATIVLVGLAVIADLIGLIPFAKDFTATIFWITAGAYLYTKGIKLWNGKRVAATAISWVASLIPVIQEIPLEVTAGIIAVIVITRIEDKTGLSVLKPLASGQPLPSMPLNRGGVRAPSGSASAPLNEDGVRRPSAPAYGQGQEGENGSAPRLQLNDFGSSPSTQPASSTSQRSTNYTASYTGPNAPSAGSSTSQPSSANAGAPSTTSNSASSGGGAASGGAGSGGGAGASGGGGGGGGGGK